jgi:DNA-binding GntR family transcriptional regulator
MLQTARSLVDQVYDAIVDDICGGRMEAGTHLVQERLAERFGISRQPIQHAMARLKADGMVEEVGRRGLFVTRLDPARMLDHYGVRAALDGWAAKSAALRAAQDPKLRGEIAKQGQALSEAATKASETGGVAALVRLDSEFHALIYTASGNRMIAETAEPHWRFLRRAMGDVLRRAGAPGEIWQQHGEILDAITAGKPAEAAELAEAHARDASLKLADALTGANPEGEE